MTSEKTTETEISTSTLLSTEPSATTEYIESTSQTTIKTTNIPTTVTPTSISTTTITTSETTSATSETTASTTLSTTSVSPTSKKDCDYIQIVGNSQYVSNIITSPFEYPDKLFPNAGGLSFDELNVTIEINIVSDITVEVKNIQLANKNTNVEEYTVSLFDSNGEIQEIRETSSPLSPLTLVESFNISKIIVQITKTTNNENPIFVELEINICSKESTSPTTTLTTTLTTGTEQTTEKTSTSSKATTEVPTKETSTEATSVTTMIPTTVSPTTTPTSMTTSTSTTSSTTSSTSTASTTLSTTTTTVFNCLYRNNASIPNQIIKTMKFNDITPLNTLNLSKDSLEEGFVLDAFSSFSIDFTFNINVTIINIHLLSTNEIQVSYSTDLIEYTSFEKTITPDAFIYSISVNPYILTEFIRY